jgi:hypothetical protein
MNHDPYRQAAAGMAGLAINRLQLILSEAASYLNDGKDLAAWGTLVLFDDAAEDLKAAIRLHQSANRRQP